MAHFKAVAFFGIQWMRILFFPFHKQHELRELNLERHRVHRNREASVRRQIRLLTTVTFYLFTLLVTHL